MKISEKTLEINFARQWVGPLGANCIWFGLTQDQESKWGFDIATKVGLGLYIFQFKASRRVLASGARQFRASHEQLRKLRTQKFGAAGVPIPNRSVFYAFPTIGTTADLVPYPVPSNTWLCDVVQLWGVGPPVAKVPVGFMGPPPLRADHSHYVNVAPGSPPLLPGGVGAAIFHSVPYPVRVQLGSAAIDLPEDVERARSRRERYGLLRVLEQGDVENFLRMSRAFDGNPSPF